MQVYAENKNASFQYEIVKTFDAGLSLLGPEVKSIQKSLLDLKGSVVLIRGGSAYWVGANIQPYQAKNMPKDYLSDRPRQLLLNKKEIEELIGATSGKKLTIVPLLVYNKNNRVKLKIALARHRKKSDKRQAIKKRETKKLIKKVLG